MQTLRPRRRSSRQRPGATVRSTPTNPRTIRASSSRCPPSDATQVGGCDLTAPYADFAWVRNQGINGPVFALLALDSRNYLSGSAVRRQCVDAILAAELSSGGWAMKGSQLG